MATFNTPFPPDHFGFLPDLIKDKGRADRDTLSTIDTFVRDDFRWIHASLRSRLLKKAHLSRASRIGVNLRTIYQALRVGSGTLLKRSPCLNFNEFKEFKLNWPKKLLKSLPIQGKWDIRIQFY